MKPSSIKMFGLAALVSIITGCTNIPKTRPNPPTDPVTQTTTQPTPNPNPNPSYDNSTCGVSEKSIEDMLASAYQIKVVGEYKEIEGVTTMTATYKGTAFVAETQDNKQYMATASHIVELPETIFENFTTYTLKGYTATLIVEGEEKCLQLISQDIENDVAILKTSEDLGIKRMFDFADKPLRPGDVLYTVGFPMGLGKFLSRGVITNVDNDAYFFEDSPINPGFSGGPSYVLEDNIPKIAGINEFYIRGANDIYGAVKYKHITALLKEALKIGKE